MVYALLLLISLIGCAALWFTYKHNIELFACLLIFINFEGFYLLPQIGRFPIYHYIDILFISLFVPIRFFKGELRFGRYGIWIAVFILLLLNSIFVAHLSGQGFDLGFKAVKSYFLILAYFLFMNTSFSDDKFAKYFILMGIAIAVTVCLQYLFYEHINIFPGLSEELREALIKQRLGKPRINIGSIVTAIAGVLSFASFCKKDEGKFLYLLTSVSLFLYILIINQTRMLVLAMLVSMLVLFFLANKHHPGKIILVIFSITLIVMVGSFFTDLIREHSSLVQLTKIEMTRKQGSVHARLQAYEFYWREILKHPFLGQGILNLNWAKNPETRLHLLGINLSDIGIISWVFTAGTIGFVWFITGLGLIWSDIMRCNRCLIASAFLILATISMPTIDLFIRKDHIILFAIFLAIFSNGVAASKAIKRRSAAQMPEATP